MKTKTCFKCHTERPLDEFYKHSRMADGHLNKCKECTKNDVNSHRARHLEEHKIRDRLRYENPERRRDCIDRSREASLKNKERIARTKALYKERNPEKRAAHDLVNGRLKKEKPSVCQKCGSSGRIHGHHPDYSKPLEVMWLYPRCHGLEHRKSRVIQNETGA